jgi:hypothetical protein
MTETEKRAEQGMGIPAIDRGTADVIHWDEAKRRLRSSFEAARI